MSDYASPWAEPTNNWNDEPEETTEQMLEDAERDRRDEDAAAHWSHILWNKYANRMKADGGLIR